MKINEKFVNRANYYIGYGPQKFNDFFGLPMGTAWCAEFVCKCANDVGALGKCIVKTAGAGSIPRESIAKGWGTWYEGQKYIPKVGDIVVFTWNGLGYYPGHDKYYSDHVGIVEKVENNKVYTIEGNANGSNTSSTVCRKQYQVYDMKFNGFYHPNWKLADPSYTESTSSKPSTQSKPSNSSTGKNISENIKACQKWLNKEYGTSCTIDGEYGPKTKSAIVGALQCYLNGMFHANLNVDGVMGPKTKQEIRVVKEKATGPYVQILQCALICRGYDTGGFDGDFGPKTKLAVVDFQKKHCKMVDGEAGPETFYELLK